MDLLIDRLQRRAARHHDGLSLAGGLPLATLFPRKRIAAASQALTSDVGAEALQYGWPEGNEVLRSWIAARLTARGATVAPGDVIITTGAQQALATIVEVLGLEGQTLGVDAETYPGALELFRRRNAVATATSDAAAFYVIPGASNPRGLGLSDARRAALLASGKPLIADEAYAELRYDGKLERPLLADAPDRVFHVGTLSKTLAPGFRLGWVVAPAEYRWRVLEAKRDADLQAPSLTQAIVERLLADFDWDAHLVKSRRRYARRMELLTRAVRRHLPEFEWTEPEGGFALFVTAPDAELDEVKLLGLATRVGTSFDPGSMFRPDGASHPPAMRLCPCNVRARDVDVAVRRIARAVELFRAGHVEPEPLSARAAGAR